MAKSISNIVTVGPSISQKIYFIHRTRVMLDSRHAGLGFSATLSCHHEELEPGDQT
jgi:hypothetical protein